MAKEEPVALMIDSDLICPDCIKEGDERTIFENKEGADELAEKLLAKRIYYDDVEEYDECCRCIDFIDGGDPADWQGE